MVPAKLKDYVSGTSAGSSFKSPPKVDALSYAFTEIPGPLQIPSFHSDYSSPGDHSGSGSLSESFADNIPSSSIAPLFDFTYEHAEDENGNHVITGRQGILQRMEDEVRMSTYLISLFVLRRFAANMYARRCSSFWRPNCGRRN